MSLCQLIDHETGRIVVEHLTIADRFWLRLVGLQFRRALPIGHGLLLAPCSSIHTLFMRFAIDVIWLDRDGKVLAVRADLSPWRAAIGPRQTHAVLELPAGAASLNVGNTVALRGKMNGVLPKALSRFVRVNDPN